MSRTERILVVCTANICRSPVGAALLEEALAGSGIGVGSAGTHAVRGYRTVPEAVEFVRRRTGSSPRSTAASLSADTARRAGLVLTMTESQRAEVAGLAPAVLRRVFTLRQFVRITPLLPVDAHYASVDELAEAVARCRARAGPARGGEDDIEDPFGGPPEGYRDSFKLIEDACAATAEVLLSKLPRGRSGSGTGGVPRLGEPPTRSPCP